MPPPLDCRRSRSLLPLLALLLPLLLGLPHLGCQQARPGGGSAGSGGSPAGSSGASAGSGAAGDAVELLFTYGSEKEDWIKEATDRFNSGGYKLPSGRPIRVQAVPQGSGESIEDLLSGARKADLTSPASAAFIRLGNAESRTKTGRDLIGETQNLVLSPVVIAMWRPMAEALGWPGRRIGWGEILKLAQDPKGWSSYGHAEWGAFRFGHTHPDYSNSGLIALLAETYAAAGKVRGLTTADVTSPATARYVAGIEGAVVHYGSSTGFFGKKMFTLGPQYLSAAVLYESLVIESAGPAYHLPFPVVAIYPKEGTFWSDHPVGVVEREWVTPERRQAAKVYIDFLLARPQQERALAFGFRPAAVDVPLAAPVDAAHGVDPKEPQTTLEVPPVDVIDAVRQLFRQVKKHAAVTLVLDTSGSMNDDQKMDNAKAGAEQLLALLDGEDTFSFLPFSSTMAWAMQDVRLDQGRANAVEHVRGVFAHGQTELYDAIEAAFDHQLEISRRDPNIISAVVVLTDGEDTNSRILLPELLRKIRSDNETKNVRIFTIGYGKDARRDVLEQIADATEARFYVGNPGNIRSVFREISTFF